MKSDTLFLAIDGGGSKTEFLLTDAELNHVRSFVINEGANPWHGTVEKTCEVMRDGLKQLSEEERAKTVYVYAGISGCFTPGAHTEAIEHTIEKYIPHSHVGGDIQSSFRALSTKTYGLMALAGSGSSVTNFGKGGDITIYDGIGYGGRELSHMIYTMVAMGHIDSQSSLGTYVERFLRKNTIHINQNMSILEQAHDSKLMQLSHYLGQLDESTDEFGELKLYLDVIVLRWAYKICAITGRFKYEFDTEWELVLNGGFWDFDYIRRNVIAAVKKNADNIIVRYDPESKPIHGCIELAKEYYEKGK